MPKNFGPGRCHTMFIRTKPCKGNPTGIVEINESDYDPRIHNAVKDDAPELPLAAIAGSAITTSNETASGVGVSGDTNAPRASDWTMPEKTA